MPGYNHYADCECGWCVNYGRSSSQSRVLDQLRQRDALTLLKRHGAKSIAGCFVNPNARCPVCGEPVFFYANQFGSRVYFDDLGPPWPKHPCTDNPRRPVERSIEFDGAPLRRARGQTLELIAAANIVGHFSKKVLGSRTPQEWTLLMIISVERQGDKNFVKAEFLDSSNHEVTSFKCLSSESIFEVGDFISKKGNEVSFLHKQTLVPASFVVGGAVPSPQISAPRNNKNVPSSRLSPGARLIKKQTQAALTKKDRGSSPDPTTSEMMHFRSETVTRETFCLNLAPVVKSLAREGTRKPRDVALRLNYQGHKTACGDKWTARLVRVLLGFIFNNKGNSDQAADSNRATDEGKQLKVTSRKERMVHLSKTPSLRQPLTHEEIAKRKAVLNRIIHSKN